MSQRQLQDDGMDAGRKIRLTKRSFWARRLITSKRITNPVILRWTWIIPKNLSAGLLSKCWLSTERRRSFSVIWRSLQDDGMGEGRLIKTTTWKNTSHYQNQTVILSLAWIVAKNLIISSFWGEREPHRRISVLNHGVNMFWFSKNRVDFKCGRIPI